jgi:hypothetical protein
MISPAAARETKKPGGENEFSSRVEVRVGTTKSSVARLPDYLETNVSFSSRRPFSWPELSLLFSLP